MLFNLVDTDMPVCFVGDFNVLLEPSEKRGGQFFESSEVFEFREVLVDNGLIDVGFVGPSFTWFNMQQGQQRTWDRLDRGVRLPE